MGPGPPITAMAIADAIFDEIRNSGTDVKRPESTRPHGVAPHVVCRDPPTKRTKPTATTTSAPICSEVDRTPRHADVLSRTRRPRCSAQSRTRASRASSLAFVFDAKHLENSLVMYQKRAVKKLVAVKSGALT